MLGAIIGDICGSVYEFNNEKDIDKLVLFKKGCFPTDDSVMTAAVAAALMDSWGRDDESVKKALVESMRHLGRLFPRAGYGGQFRRWLADPHMGPYGSWGNGSGMRISAAGFMYGSLDETLRAAELTAEVTHDHPEGIKGAKAIAAAVYLARTGSSKEEIRRFTEDNFYALDFTLDGIRPDYCFDVSCQGSCPQAIEAFLEGVSFEDVILKAISIGGDSDTIASMAGGIAEAYYGVPEDMKQKTFEVLQDTETRGRYYPNGVLLDIVKEFYEWLEEHRNK